jgi:hypothetical protein
MDTSIVTALAALLGSLIGGFTSFATTWLSQRQSEKAQRLREEVAKREALYSAFMEEACQRLADAVENNIQQPAQVVRFFSMYYQIRLLCSDEVAKCLEKVLEATIILYKSPNVTLHDVFQRDERRTEGDSLSLFGDACRFELQALKRGLG